ncbi:glycoside hydrolase family 25 protein [Aurantimonas sp. DM33-3]|uniref:glycoside hydrolase family 25 protein n=1 Tax=Aurantimonas sp. DM33-3 TaxID=2766955 RepID=UPI001FEDB9CD|nr:glycoside hydrolase family 25 protein [Aurantimonas sp. DM33-3]
MTKTSAAFAAALKFACTLAAGVMLVSATPAQAEWNAPWKSEDNALVIDAYEFNPINWQELASDKRIAGFINKASDGLPPEWSCGKSSGDDYKLCKNRWWKYSVTKELYMTRREMAKMKGLLWGAYHLGRPGNPREQADHFVDFAEPAEDDLIALDIEDNSDEWMSLSDAEIFADQIKIRTGRYPVLYTNGSTARYISQNKAEYPLLSRLPLWYARYREDITGKFPEETWPSYALWQFSSMHNCNSRSCPYRVKGAKTDIDVNVSSLDVAGLKAAWPFAELIDEPKQETDPAMLVASLDEGTKAEIAKAAKPRSEAAKAKGTPSAPVVGTVAAAYGPSEVHATLDPLKILTEVARKEHAGPKRVVAEPGAALAGAVLDTAAVEQLGDHVETLKGAIAYAANEIDRLFIGRAEAATRPEGASAPQLDEMPNADRRAGLDVRQRSRFLAIVESAAAAQRANALPMPARVLSQLGPDTSERGSRVVPQAQRHAGLERPERRILSAFAATR